MRTSEKGFITDGTLFHTENLQVAIRYYDSMDLKGVVITPKDPDGGECLARRLKFGHKSYRPLENGLFTTFWHRTGTREKGYMDCGIIIKSKNKLINGIPSYPDPGEEIREIKELIGFRSERHSASPFRDVTKY